MRLSGKLVFLAGMIAGIFLVSGCGIFHRGKVQKPPVKIETFETKLDKINPTDRKFPGGRGPDELVLYTPAFGKETGTNKWGTEAVVKGGIVRCVGGNNSPIPPEGFVISGHGKSARWIATKLYPGTEVNVEGKTLKARITARTRLFNAASILKETSERLASMKAPDRSISLRELKALKRWSERWMARSEKAARKGNSAQALIYAQCALDTALQYFHKSQPSRKSELRAVWYRLTEKSPQELQATVERLASAGFNCIFPETIYWGYAIYPDAHPTLKQNPAFRGWDPLKELIRIAHEKGIEVHPWVEVYFIGFADSPLVAEKPEWLALARNGDYASHLEKGYYYFCPSNDEVRKFWLNVYKHLLETYDIDGLQLDYIRYPRSVPWYDGYCYCANCREKFFNQFDIDAASLDPAQNKPDWGKWCKFRKAQVTEFVRQVSALVKKIRPDITLSADVFPDIDDARMALFQNWQLWAEKGYLDALYVMSYTPDIEEVRRTSTQMAQIVPKQVCKYIGLGPYLGFGQKILLDEIRTAQEAGADGISLFSLGQLTDEDMTALRQGPFRLPATIPGRGND